MNYAVAVIWIAGLFFLLFVRFTIVLFEILKESIMIKANPMVYKCAHCTHEHTVYYHKFGNGDKVCCSYCYTQYVKDIKVR